MSSMDLRQVNPSGNCMTASSRVPSQPEAVRFITEHARYDGAMPKHLLDPNVCFLNHGSFGSTPKELLDLQTKLRHEMEREPVDFLVRTRDQRWLEAVRAVSDFLDSDPASTVFVPNATSGINAVINSFPWSPGDEILTTNHRYDAVRRTLDHAALRQNLTVREADVPFPIDAPSQIITAIEEAISPRTRMIAVDHISSPTALISPVDAIITLARDRGLAVLIDGAHAPGQVDIDLRTNPPDFWVGNLHKWLCAPKGCAVLFVEERWRNAIHPTSISHGYSQGLHEEFSWTGTLDPTAIMCAKPAIELHNEQGGDAFRDAHHRLVQHGRRVIADALAVDLPHPDDPHLYAAMATVPLPMPAERTDDLWMALRKCHNIEVPIIPWQGKAWVRISGYAAYNKPEQYSQLASALTAELFNGSGE